MNTQIERRLEKDEASLIRGAVAGSGTAFAQLVRLHQAAVRWCLYRYVRDQSTVDDLAQEVFLNAFKQLGDYRGTGSFRSWLVGMARNVAKQHIRTDSRRRNRETGPLAIQLAEWRIDRLESESMDRENSEQMFSSLVECIDSLPPKSRTVVEEHYFQNHTLESIGRRQGRSGGSVRIMLFRVRQILGECIREKLKDEV